MVSCSCNTFRQSTVANLGDVIKKSRNTANSRPHIPPTPTIALNRRLILSSTIVSSILNHTSTAWATVPPPLTDTIAIQRTILEAYSKRDFATALPLLNDLITQDPNNPSLLEQRAQLLVDYKKFAPALVDFQSALRLTPPSSSLIIARLLSGKALALEGLGDWVAALDTYNQALDTAASAQQPTEPDPYVLNSVANCYVSLGEFSKARTFFLASAAGFQSARGFRDSRGRMTPRLDGAIYASSNAALMLVQLGDEEGAVREMQAVARRAPGSVDMRAALAALYWDRGDEAAAESEWNFGCTNINEGCRLYEDEDWLRRIRRWPPVMVDKLRNFRQMKSSGNGGGKRRVEGEGSSNSNNGRSFSSSFKE